MKTRMVGLLVAGLILAGCGTADMSSDGETNSEVVEADATADEPTEEDRTTETDDEQPGDEADDTSGDTGDDAARQEAGDTAEEEADRQDIEITDSGFSSYTAYDDSTRASWAAVLTNPNDDLWLATSIDITVTLLDDAGSVLASQSDSLAVLLPGQSGAVTGSTLDDVAGLADIRVQARVRNWESQPGPFGSFQTSDVSVREDDFGGWTVTGQVASTFTDDFDDVYAVAVFRNADNDIIGGAFTFIDFVPGDGDTSFQINAFDDLVDVDSSEVYVTLSSLSLW